MLVIDIIIPVKNGGDRLGDVIESWYSQRPDGRYFFKIYIVDDGSNDGAVDDCAERFPDVVVIRNQESQGRASACNRGAAAGRGSIILFIDADCLATSADILTRYFDAFSSEVNVVFGSIRSNGFGFWRRYFSDVCARREALFCSGRFFAMTTANMAIRRVLFEKIGGFDTRYSVYGFEDRDLLVRLKSWASSMRFNEKALVHHSDDVSLSSVCKKMYLCGRYSSAIFMERHPEVYRELEFYKVDVRCHSRFFYFASKLVVLFSPMFESLSERVLASSFPYGFKTVVVKFCSGLFFLKGTVDSKKSV